jgi:hypothetical protein
MSVRARILIGALLLTAASAVADRGSFAAVSAQQPTPAAAATGPVFEVRTYVASAGKFDALKARFRDHVLRLFERHGMKSVVYWSPADAPGATTTLTYILQHASREAAAKSWAAFNADPEWMKIRTESNANGNLVARVESYFATPADFSPIK